MSEEGFVVPEWGIRLRNLVNRMVPVVNEDHSELVQLRADNRQLEAKIAQLNIDITAMRATMGQILARQETTIGAVQALNEAVFPSDDD